MSDASPFPRQQYSNLDQWRRARYMQAMSDDESQLVLVEAQLNALLADRPIDSYNFNAGDGGSQQATYRKISDLQTLKMQLRDNIERYARLIWGGALVNHNLRRKG